MLVLWVSNASSWSMALGTSQHMFDFTVNVTGIHHLHWLGHTDV